MYNRSRWGHRKLRETVGWVWGARSPGLKVLGRRWRPLYSLKESPLEWPNRLTQKRLKQDGLLPGYWLVSCGETSSGGIPGRDLLNVFQSSARKIFAPNSSRKPKSYPVSPPYLRVLNPRVPWNQFPKGTEGSLYHQWRRCHFYCKQGQLGSQLGNQRVNMGWTPASGWLSGVWIPALPCV